MWMNEYDVEDAWVRLSHYDDMPNLVDAANTLRRLVDWTNRNSDGWPYWQAPSKAAARLQELLHNASYTHPDADITDAEKKAAYRPIKAFLTRQGVDHEKIWPTPPPQVDLRAQPMTLSEARAILNEEPVGFKALTESGPTCTLPCLAQGSSPHSHVKVVGYTIIGPTTVLTLDANLMGVSSGSLHPFTDEVTS